MHADMGSDVISFDDRGGASSPGASQGEVIGALAPDMMIAKVVLIKGDKN